MFTKISEIRTAVATFRNTTTYQRLRRRWQDDFDLWRLKEYDAGKGYYSYTTNSPRTAVNKAISMLDLAKLIIKMPLDALLEDSRETASNVERLLYGVLNLNDERLLKQGKPILRNQQDFHTSLRGSEFIKIARSRICPGYIG